MNISSILVRWYTKNKRDLPWRNTRDPYKIWLSEIILQQTRVAQGLAYYIKFIQAFPTIQALAQASEDEVLKLWQGLGYYSRARNLHFTAKYIHTHLDNKFPRTYKEILKLKGIGPYTASAISSFAYDLPHASIDGNVIRVITRLFGIKESIDTRTTAKKIAEIAEQLLDRHNPSAHNQAIMEFGALQCVPKNPACEQCPFMLSCFAFQNRAVGEIPYKAKKIKQRERFFNYLFIVSKGFTFLNKRTQKDIWKNLYEFPLIETPKAALPEDLFQTKEWGIWLGKEKTEIQNISKIISHQLSHQKIHAIFYQINVKEIKPEINARFVKVKLSDLNNYAIPRLIDKYLDEIIS